MIDFEDLKNKVATRKEAISKATGRVEQNIAALSKYGCDSVEAARAKVKELMVSEEEQDKIVADLDRSLEEMKISMNL